jgi:hypothetical protein
MRFKLVLSVCFLATTVQVSAAVDSLLPVLDQTIAQRETYMQQKNKRIEALKQRKQSLHTATDIYNINWDIIRQYESFMCDSTEVYINQNIELARQTGNKEWMVDSRLQQAFVYALSGLFVEAGDVLKSFDQAQLHGIQRARWYWYSIRYLENYSQYTADPELIEINNAEIARLRDTLLSILPPDSPEYLKEKAFKLLSDGNYRSAIDILQGFYADQQPNSHSQAMAAASLAKVYRMTGERDLENHFLAIAAIADTRYAAKENEALLTLAMNLFTYDGDVKRAYTYVRAALDDANFYHSRFRNSIIARVQPVVERNYLNQIEKQKYRLIIGIVIAVLLGIGLIVALSVVFRQLKLLNRARTKLREMNSELIKFNSQREASYIIKLENLRKEVNQKIRSGQTDQLYKPSSVNFEKDMNEMCANFDKSFLKLYPDFVREFNSTLIPEARYEIKEGCLNTELRIFALIKLGITDTNQIAQFLNCSPQTIYNYRSKVKKSTKTN